jgi:hypothetical protein
MKVLQEITRHEMLRRWVLGELDSAGFWDQGVDDAQRARIRNLLSSDDIAAQCEGILAHTSRVRYWNSLPTDSRWKLAELELAQREFERLRTVNDPAWQSRTNGTFRLVDAAKHIAQNPGIDVRVSNLIAAMREGNFNDERLVGITLFSNEESDLLTAVEVTARLIALCLCRLRNAEIQHGIQVAWGSSPTPWPGTPPA